MKQETTMRFPALLLLSLGALGGFGVAVVAAHKAEAADVGDRCYSAHEASALMASEGALLVVEANRVFTDPAHPYSGQFYYLNPDTKVAYLITSDVALNQVPNCAKIEVKMDNANLFDARLTEVDPLAKINGNRALAAQECIALNKDPTNKNPGNCYHNDNLEYALRHGSNVFFQGTLEDVGHGEMPPTTKLTIVGNPTDITKGGQATLSTMDGAAIQTGVFDTVIYAPNGVRLLEQRAQMVHTP